MPIFEYEGKKYNVKDGLMDKFAGEFPDATSTLLATDGKTYTVKAKDMGAFQARQLYIPESKTTPEPVAAPSHVITIDPTKDPYMGGMDEGPMGVDNSREHEALTKAKEAVRSRQQEVKQKLEEDKKEMSTFEKLLSYIPAPYNSGGGTTAGDVARERRAYESDAELQALRAEEAKASVEASNADQKRVEEKLAKVQEAARGRKGEIDAKVDEEEKNLSFVERHMGTLGGVYMPGAFRGKTQTRRGRAYEYDTDLQALRAAETKLKDSKDVMEEVENANKDALSSSGLFRFGRGFAQKATDTRVWDGGEKELRENTALMEALNAYESGKKLTDAQKALLDASAEEVAAMANYGDEVGMGYTVGQSVAESLPYMAEFAINPFQGGARSVGSRLMNYALRKVPRSGKVLNAAVRTARKLAGDVFAAGAMTATSGSVRTTADAIDRHNGEVKVNYDEEGNPHFGGHEAGDPWGEAIGKAIGASMITYGAEMSGKYLAPGAKAVKKAAKKGLEKIGLGRVNQMVDNLGNSAWGRMVGNLQNKTEWSGILEEYGEEMVDNIANAIFVGDKNFKLRDAEGKWFSADNSVFNLKDNITTLASVSVMGGVMGGAKLVGTAYDQHSAKREMVKADNRAAAAFANSEKWNDIRDAVNSQDEETITGVMYAALTDEDLNDEQKRLAIDYMRKACYYAGFNKAADKTHMIDGLGTTDKAVSMAYNRGYDAEEATDINTIANRYEVLRQQAKEQMPAATLEALDHNPSVALYAIENNAGWTPEERNLARRYVMAQLAMQGVSARVNNDIDEKVDASQVLVNSRANDKGKVVTAKTKDDKTVYVVKGHVEPYQDGTGIALEKSDNTIWVRDEESGKTQQMSASDLLEVVSVENANELKQTAANEIAQRRQSELEGKISGVVSFAEGEYYDVYDGETTGRVRVAPDAKGVVDNGDGTVNVADGTIDEATNEARVMPMRKDVLQQMIAAANYKRAYDEVMNAENEDNVRARENAQAAPGAPQASAAAPTPQAPQAPQAQPVQPTQTAGQSTQAQAAFELNDEVVLRDEQGNNVKGFVTAVNPDDGTVEFEMESVFNGKRAPLMTFEEATQALVPAGEDRVEEAAQNAPAPQGASAMQRIPKDENGNPIYEQADSDIAWDAIVEQTEGDEAMAQTVADAMVSKKEAALKKLEKTKPKGGETPAEIIAAEKERKAAIDAAKQEVEIWKKIAATANRRKMEVEAERRRVAEEAAALRKAEEEKMRAEREEAERIEREALNGVPDMVDDTPQDARGLFPEDNYSFGNELVSVTDVEGDNVLLGEDGTLYFIDPIIRFKKPLREIISTLGGGQEHTPTIGEQVQAAEAEVNTTPTDKQKEAGNYKKGHVQIGTFNVTIEQPKGSVRSGVDKGGKKWEVEMQNTYGYIRGTEGVDGDHIDVFLSNDIDGWNGRQVYVIDQRNADGSFDEHKVMLGFNDINEAEEAYLSNYEQGWQGLGAITGVAIEDFEKWIASSHRKTKAFAEYKSVKTTEGQSASADLDKRQNLANFNVGDVVRDYYDHKLYRIKKHSTNGVSTIAELDAEGNEVRTTTMNAHNNSRYSLAEAPTISQDTDQVSDQDNAPYTIAPAQYTTKKGKVLDMHIVKFTGELTKEQQRAAKELAKADKGWYDREQGGFMMRSEESAKQLADTIIGNEEAVSEAQPVSMTDIQALNNGDVLFTEPQQVEQTDSEEKSPVWQYSIHVDKETGRTTLRRDDVSGIYPIGDARWQHTAESPEEMLDILRNPLNGMQEVLEAVGVTLENKIKTRELDRKSKEQAPTAETNPSGNRLVTDERYAELRERMRKKLGGQMNIGIDPEILAIGTEMAVYHLEKGARKFTEFAKAMVADLGDVIRPYLKAFYNGARNLPEVEGSELSTDMTPYDEVQTFDVANFDKQGIDAFATAETVTREAEVAQEVEVAQQRIKKTRSVKNKSVNSQQEQLNLFDNGTEGENARTGNSGTELRPEELSDTQQVGSGTSVQDSASNSKGKRRNIRVSSSELGNRPKYDVNKSYTNEEIGEIVSSVTDIVDGKVVITDEVTDDIKAICRQYKSGGVAKKGRGILDEYYTDGKIVDAVRMLIAPYFNKNKPVRVLEPSVGVGNFIEAARELQTSDVVAFEINETTARIAKVLYPNVDVNLRSFETEFIDDEGKKKPLPQKYNLVIGNPPYGSHRGLYKGLGEESKIARYEDYFVKRSIDVLEDGGVLAMVLPSSWIDRHTTFGGYTIEAAYRLPSGAFEATQVGTDIVVLKKDSSIPVSEHTPYFELHSDRILGEVKERKGRYGKMEEYVQGDIDVAIDAIEREHAKQIAEQLDIEATNDNLNDIQTAIEETGSADKAKTIVESEKKVTADKKPAPKASGKQGKYKVELNRGAETLPTSSQFTHEFSEGEVEAFEDTDYNGTINNPTKHRKYANFIGGKAVHDFYYAEGDIYSKLSQLEIDKPEIVEKYGIEQYEKQKRLLESVLPKRKDLDEITISPNTTFVKNLNVSSNGEAKSLKELFIDFCRKLPYGSFGDSSTWEVIGYVNNEQVHGTDKQRNQLIRERRKRVANDLFVKFLNDELSDEAKKQVVFAFNREYNSVYRPDYSRVPMFSTINKDFKGKPLKLTSVQLAGIGRMTVKGVGVLAHEVGFGKTLSGILAMHEAMTRGFAKKPLIVVPNDNILKQWVETINEVLPQATVNTLGNLGTDYDLTDFKVNDGEFTIVTYEGLKAMSFSDDTYNRLADRFSYITEDLKKHQSERDIQKEIEKHNELKGKMKRGTKATYGFEDFGFDWLTVDEVHNANHIVSKVRLDKSVASDFRSQSQRTSDLGLKTWLAAQYIQEENNGRNVLLLSATPFTNKPLEYYSILSLVGNKMLERKGFFNVDQFFATFMEADNEMEMGANNRPVQKTNVRRFRNNGLFQQLLSEFIDIKGEEDNPELIRPTRHNREYKLAQNDLTTEAIDAAQALLNDNDTVLQGIGHARAAAFSPYATSLLGAHPKDHKEFVKNSPKIDATIKMIEQNKKDSPDAGQIIYSEVGVEFFPMIRDYLVKESGFKPNEVRIITGATSNNERVNIQTAFNNGEVKVVIGSPAIKEGLNLQGNTTDMYILSLPWNFTQLRQIEGRGWRQGNKWENIRINYMLTNNSVDVFMLQRLQLKQGLYNEAMKSGAESLDVSDIDTAELKTALITDPAVRAEIVTTQEREKLQMEKTQIEADLSFVVRKYEAYNKLINNLNIHKSTLKKYKEWAKNDDKYWNDRVEREEAFLQTIEREIEQEKENLAKKGVNVDDIVRQTEQAQNAIADIQERIDNLKEFQQELTEKFRKENEAAEAEHGDLLATYIKERKAENKSGFYKIRPTKDEHQKEEDDTLYRRDDEARDEKNYDWHGLQPTDEEITFDNFFESTSAAFEQLLSSPSRVPDFVSKSGSMYWYGEDEGGKYVIRRADHWSEFLSTEAERAAFDADPANSRAIASCRWAIDVVPQMYGEITKEDVRHVNYNSGNHVLNITFKNGKNTRRDGVHPHDMRPYFDLIKSEGAVKANDYVADMVNEKYRRKPAPKYLVGKAYLEDFTKWGEQGRGEQQEEDTLYHSDEAIKNRIEALFNEAISGEFKGKPISIGRLTDEGKAYLEQISGVVFKEYVDFVLNPSDLMHIYKDHFGNNEKDNGQNIPLDIEDIRSLVDVISSPDKVVFFKEGEGSNRNMFYFFKEAEDGTYNLMEIYSDRKGNLTAKTFYKTRKDATQRVMDIEKSLLPTSETYSGAILSDAKIPQMFESASVEDDFSAREGDGAYTDDEVSFENDPISKVLGEPHSTRKRRKEFAERERQRMVARVESLVEKLHLNNVEIVTDVATLDGKKQSAKGIYSKSTGKITIVIPNHASVFDVEQTLLHEAVAHYGLRQLFGKHFYTFLDNVFENAEVDVLRRIAELAAKKGWDFRKATEEYLATLAENTNFEKVDSSWWGKIKQMFLKMLHKIGFEGFRGVTLTDNELRYILWRSYENLAEPGRYRSILGEAADVAKQYELGVGNYAVANTYAPHAADAAEDDLLREGLTLREKYDKAVRRPNGRSNVGAFDNLAHRLREGYQDSMLSLKKLQEIIEGHTGSPLQSNEDAYTFENALSSRNKIEHEVYEREFFVPMMNEVTALMKKHGLDYFDVTDYLYAKHGLERNIYYSKKAAEKAGEAWGGKVKDYSGLSDLTGDKKDFTQKAQDMVEAFEKKVGQEAVDRLWGAINKATKETLRKSYSAGMMSRDTYEMVRDMFEYYIPLRGWDEESAEDVYGYVDNPSNRISPTLATVKGRKSLANDPLATIGSMANGTIVQSNRNLMKQRFLNMALNRPTSLLTVSEQWYTYDFATGKWVPNNPNIPADATPDEVAEIVANHEEAMKQFAKNKQAMRKHAGMKLGMPATNAEKQQHMVRVKRGSKDYVVYVNGDPRAAQAINGLLSSEIFNSHFTRGLSEVKNFMARNFTSRNPAFVLTNGARDLIWAGTAVAAKENGAYAANYSKNIAKLTLRGKMVSLMWKWAHGTLDKNVEEERYFDEFMRNGGETGYTNIQTVDDYKKNIKKLVKDAKGDTWLLTKGAHKMLDAVEFANRVVEDTTRFAVYMTSRQQGRNVQRSVWDAKEITVNFNKKGSGDLGSRWFNLGYLFFNASVQSLSNFAKLTRNNPKKMAAVLTGYFASGFLAPMVNMAVMALCGADEDKYWDLPEWKRRNNLIFYVPFTEDLFITIPLPHELRPFYGMGELLMSMASGKEGVEEGLKKTGKAFAGMLPLDFTGYGGDMVTNLTPDVVRPFVEYGRNISFFGTPIYKDGEDMKRRPEWQKAYRSTDPQIVEATKWLNEATDGNNWKKGWADWNPAWIEHMFESYLGGTGKTINNFAKLLQMPANPELREMRNVPVLNSFMTDVDERSQGSQVDRLYWQAVEEKEDVVHLENGYKRDAKAGDEMYKDLLDELRASERYQRVQIIKPVVSRVNKLEKRRKEAKVEELKKLEDAIRGEKERLIERLEEFDKKHE